MPKYLIEARYTPEAVKGVMREGGSSRRAAAAKAVESVGGKLEAFYFAFGEVDAYCHLRLARREERGRGLDDGQPKRRRQRPPHCADRARDRRRRHEIGGTFRAPGQ